MYVLFQRLLGEAIKGLNEKIVDANKHIFNLHDTEYKMKVKIQNTKNRNKSKEID